MSETIEQPKSITFETTKIDIEQGKVCSTDSCILAVALKRLGYTDVEVMGTRAYIGSVPYWFQPDLVEYVKDFDCGKPILPATFTIYHVDDRLKSAKLGRPKKESINETASSTTLDKSVEVG